MEREITQKLEILKELMLKWEEGLQNRDLEKIKEYALKIEEVGKDTMKEIWHKISPSERLSDVINKMSEENIKGGENIKDEEQ